MSFTVTKVASHFGNRGWGIFEDDELIAIVKGEERANSIAAVLSQFSQQASADLLGKWMAHQEARLREHGNRSLAIKEADEEIARLISDEG